MDGHNHGHPHKKITLKRNLDLFHATLYGVGIICGAGIYTLVGVASGMAGNAVWISFILSAFVAAFTGLSYAELSSMFTSDAGEYIYTKRSFGKRIAFVVGWLVLAASVISIPTVTFGFAGYFIKMFGGSALLVAFISVALIAVINFLGAKESARVNAVLTFLEVGGLLLIIFLGLPSLFNAVTTGSVNLLEMPKGIDGVLSAASLIFFAFIGFESVVKLSEETKNAKKVIPMALLLSLGITTVLYILVALSAVSILGWQALGASTAPLADAGAAVMGSTIFFILGILALFSTFNTSMICMLAASRISYGMSCNKSLPEFLSHIHEGRRTPWKSIIAVAIVASMMLFINDISLVAEMTNFTIFVTFIAVNSALIVLRFKEPKLKRPFRVPGAIGKLPITPVFGILFCLFMIRNLSIPIILAGAVTVVIGVAVHLVYDFFCKWQ